ncbi:DUF2274 domain-containing protein [Sphingopyxis sp. CCNWLW253]|uniref:DUF2274 domain-containing protein n=1 Tax=unclassified Sphingopyxis TaxID=2614943 RepID=UPI0030129EE1
MSRLRLGAIADNKPVKMTIEMSGSLVRDLADYADVHARLTGMASPISPEKLIPAMIERFIASDREFSRQRRNGR